MQSNINSKGTRIILSLAAILILASAVFTIFQNKGLPVNAADLMKDVKANKIAQKQLDQKFIQNTTGFSIDLFKSSIKQGKNTLISPASVYLALGMTANGANKDTLSEFEALLGKGDYKINRLNQYYHSLAKKLTQYDQGKFNIANSIWYANDRGITVLKDFLQINADYYGANAYMADFSSKETVNDINNWVKHNTNNLIDKIVDGIDLYTVMYIINTLYFDAQWQEIYKKSSIKSGKFKLPDGSQTDVEFMYSDEGIYLEDENAKGFVKPYKGNKFSFVALLPDEDISADQYAASLTGEKFLSLLDGRHAAAVNACIPKFKAEYEASLVEPLKQMGLISCFDERNADFSKMVKENNVYVGDILHKTFIQVDEKGTKAGAVTKVEMKATSALEEITIILDRPFIYAIVDNETSLPIFIGILNNPNA